MQQFMAAGSEVGGNLTKITSHRFQSFQWFQLFQSFWAEELGASGACGVIIGREIFTTKITKDTKVSD